MTDTEFISICKSSRSMAEAASKLGLHFNTFKRRALILGCYCPNQAGKGIMKFQNERKSLDAILNGDHPDFQSFKLKRKLLKSGKLIYECVVCGISEWCEKPIALELDHINGNSRDHRLENLRLLCPNCHSQTATFRSKNIKKI